MENGKKTKTLAQDLVLLKLKQEKDFKEYKALAKRKGIDLKVTNKTKALGIKAVTILSSILIEAFKKEQKNKTKVIYLKKGKKDKEEEINPFSKITNKELNQIKEIIKKELKEELKQEIKKEEKEKTKEEPKKEEEKIEKDEIELSFKEKYKTASKEDVEKEIEEREKLLEKQLKEQTELLRKQKESEEKEKETKDIEKEIEYTKKAINSLKKNIDNLNIVHQEKVEVAKVHLSKLTKKLSLFAAGVLSMPVSPVLASATLLLASRIKGSKEFVDNNKVITKRPHAEYTVDITPSKKDLDDIKENLRNALKDLEGLENSILRKYDFMINDPEIKEALSEINTMKTQIQEKQVEAEMTYAEVEEAVYEEEIGKSR